MTPIEHALKLKEIGYDKPCLFYSEGDESSIELNKTIPEDCCSVRLTDIYLKNHNAIGKLSVPTWTQVFAWFKKHYYHVNIDDKGTWIHWSFYNEMIEPPILENEPQDGWETDYYEALEALVVALIKTYKSEQNENLHLR